MAAIRRRAPGFIALGAVVAFACGPVEESVGGSTDALEDAPSPKVGFDYLVNGGYIECGFPRSVFNVLDVFGQAHMAPKWEEQHLDGRNAESDKLPYNFTAYRTPKGANLVVTNCLECHAGHINGKLIVGLGATDVDFAQDMTGAMKKTDTLVRALLTGENQREWDKLRDRAVAIDGYNRLQTRGPTIANMLMPAILAHQDPVTLRWQKETSFDLAPSFELPVDVPPWWNVKKKKAVFYNAMGTGDFTKHMMLASSFCIDDVSQAKEINTHFKHVKAFIESIEPPKYAFGIDSDKARRGATVFTNACAGCHGTYGEKASYPDRVIPIDAIETDALLINQISARKPYLDWHERSYYGIGAPVIPQQGYVAPPLDGIWATAPYLHNGSVPTLRALLDSKTRPTYFRRSFRSTDYDPTNVGWNYSVETKGKDAFSGDDRVNLYDTTLPGYGNGGHTFGDSLSDVDRDELIEYLKTL